MRILKVDANHCDRPVVMSSPRKNLTLIAANVAALLSPVSTVWCIFMEPSIERIRYVEVFSHNGLEAVELESQLAQLKGGIG